MRKDVRFGLTIGAILLAVLVVYVLVVPGGSEPDLVTLDTLDPIAAESQASTDSDSSFLDEITPVTTETPRIETTTPESAPVVTETPVAAINTTEQFDWDAMLTHGRLIAVEQPQETRQPAQRPAVEQPVAPVQAPVATPARSIETSTPSLSAAQTYTVKAGDNFWTIAQAVYGDGSYYKLIEQANPGVNPNNLRIGQELRLPARSEGASPVRSQGGRNSSDSALGARQYRVQKNDSLHRIAQKLYGDGSRWQEIYQLNRQTIGSDPAKLKLGMVLQLPEEPTSVSANR